MDLTGFYLRSSIGTLHASENSARYNYTRCGRRLKNAYYNISPGSVKTFCKKCGISEEKVFDKRQWEFDSIGLPVFTDWNGIINVK